MHAINTHGYEGKGAIRGKKANKTHAGLRGKNGETYIDTLWKRESIIFLKHGG